MTSRHPVLTTVGETQASSVIPVVKASDGEFPIVTIALVPLKTSAPPYLPAAVHVALLIVPLLPWPDRSLTTVPWPSSNE